jgi:hypothetical protein
MATNKILSLELNKTPPVHLFYDGDWACKVCGSSIALLTGDDWNCVMCAIAVTRKDTITVFGWQISKSGVGQIHASRMQGSS